MTLTQYVDLPNAF
jgi:hypothetical protein